MWFPASDGGRRQHRALEPPCSRLAVCAEMVFLDFPIEERVRRIADSGFQVEIWNWTNHDIDALVRAGAQFASMVGHTAGNLLDADGAAAFLQGAENSVAVAERLGWRRLVVFGTELGPDGVPPAAGPQRRRRHVAQRLSDAHPTGRDRRACWSDLLPGEPQHPARPPPRRWPGLRTHSHSSRPSTGPGCG